MPFFPIQRFTFIEDPLDLGLIPTALVLQPKCHRHLTKPHAEKFRVQLDVNGFNPETISTKIEGRKLIVEAKQEERLEDGDYNIRQLRKSYELPEHAGRFHSSRFHKSMCVSDLDESKLTSFVTRNNMLVIEVPIKTPEQTNQSLAQFGQFLDPSFDYAGFVNGSDFQPKIIDKDENQKQLEMTIGMKNFQPNEMKVTVKDNALIVKGEHRQEDENGSQQSFFYRSIMLPPGTQVNQLESHLTDDGQLKIQAPYIEPKQPAIENQ